MESIKEFIIAYLPAFISVIGAIVAIYKVKPETKKIVSEATKNEGEASSAIGDAAESIANAAKITNEQLLKQLTDLRDQFSQYKTESQEKIGDLQLTVKNERQARIELEQRLTRESQARIRAESKINALQRYIEQLKTLMRTVDLTPPPFVE